MFRGWLSLVVLVCLAGLTQEMAAARGISVQPVNDDVAKERPSAEPKPKQIVAKKIEIYGQRMYYLEANAPLTAASDSPLPTIVLLHGLAGDTRHWEHTIPALANHSYRVLVPDQIGFGKSDKPDIEYRIATFVAYLRAFLQATNTPRATLVGNSLGGWVAAAFTLAHPEMVDQLVLVDAAGLSNKFVHDVLVAEKKEYLYRGTLGWMKDSPGLAVSNFPVLTDMMLQRLTLNKLGRSKGFTLNQYRALTGRGDEMLDERVSDLPAGTMILWGTNDTAIPPGVGAAFAARIPNAQMVWLDKCGHVPQNQCYGEFNSHLLNYLSVMANRGETRKRYVTTTNQ